MFQKKKQNKTTYEPKMDQNSARFEPENIK